jgi:CHAT domain
LAEALAEPIAAGLVELVWVPQATRGRVHAQLLAGEWHVLHFVGHGDYDTHNDEGVLALVGEDGRAELVEASKLADLLLVRGSRGGRPVLRYCRHAGPQRDQCGRRDAVYG